MRFVGPILIKLWTSCIWGFPELPLWWTLGDCLCKHAGHHSVTTGACRPPHLTCLGLCSMAAWKLNGPICAMIICKAWNSPVEYPRRKCKHDIKKSKGDMFNPISKENVQGWKHPGSCTFAEPELLSCRKPKHVVQKVTTGHKNPNNCHNYHDGNHDEIEFYQRNSKRCT